MAWAEHQGHVGDTRGMWGAVLVAMTNVCRTVVVLSRCGLPRFLQGSAALMRLSPARSPALRGFSVETARCVQPAVVLCLWVCRLTGNRLGWVPRSDAGFFL